MDMHGYASIWRAYDTYGYAWIFIDTRCERAQGFALTFNCALACDASIRSRIAASLLLLLRDLVGTRAR